MFKEQQKRDGWYQGKIETKPSGLHGLGVFASEDIEKHTVIEICPVICFHRNTMYLLRKEMIRGYQRHVLHDYVFAWTEGQVAIALGYGSLYNHSNDESNVSFQMRTDLPGIEFITKRGIKKGEELLVHYRKGERDVEFDISGGII